MSNTTKILYLSKNQAAARFGTVFSIPKKLLFSNLKSYCQLFMGEKIVIHIKEMLKNSTGIINESDENVENLKKQFIDNMYDNMQRMIEDRKIKLEEYHKSGFISKARFKLSKLLSENGDQADPDYVQKSINYLSLKNREDLCSMFSFCVEYFSEEVGEAEDCVSIPENLDEILTLKKLYIAVTNHNILQTGVYTAMLKNIKSSFVCDEVGEHMFISFQCENKEYPEFPGMIYVKLMEDEYHFVNNWSYHKIFTDELEAHDHLIATTENKIADLNEKLKCQKEARYLAGINKNNHTLMLENKD